jgi:hypothetical protein
LDQPSSSVAVTSGQLLLYLTSGIKEVFTMSCAHNMDDYRMKRAYFYWGNLFPKPPVGCDLQKSMGEVACEDGDEWN